MGKVLYLGLDPARSPYTDLVHLPIIETVPRPLEGALATFFENVDQATHIVVTSRSAARYFCQYATAFASKQFLCIGKATETFLREQGCLAIKTASTETAEGVIDLLKDLSASSHIFYPHSSLARPVISDFLKKSTIAYEAVELYDTVPRQITLPCFSLFEKIIFTSPSTVEAFFALATEMPPFEKCQAMGPITASALHKLFLSKKY